jgi:Asp-tRNA(Asn)/Glu-tRNA(Gln) amidotransferase A subunit family amidase
LTVRSCRCRPLADNGLPVGCILSARPGSDMEMCGWARQLVAALAA